MKYAIRKVIRLLGEIEPLIKSDIFYNLEWEEYDDEQLKIEARVHLDDIAPFIDSENNRIYRNRTLFIGGK
tara:strand:+ start:208 stop:420 length:213 start_codon:yes stop_codon:yes gene_type:complete